MTALLIVPEPCAWTEVLRAELEASDGGCRVIAPPSPTRLTGRLPAQHRIRARLAWRRAVDRLACRAITASSSRVVAPSLAAARCLARARDLGVPTELIEDLPDLGELHADLDAAARAHPHQDFLRNHRASHRRVVRQRAERLLADRIRVQGRHAADRLPPHVPCRPLFPAPGPPQRPPRLAQPPRIARLAGPALARTGLLEVLAAVEQIPGLELQIRPIDITPAWALDHPRVRTDRAPADVVLAPAWVECWPPEVRQAARAGIPVIGTRRALGFESGVEVPVGDVEALVRALAALGESEERPTRHPRAAPRA